MNYRTIGPLVEFCNFKSNMRESSCQSKEQVMAIVNWSSGERCGPWASCFFYTFYELQRFLGEFETDNLTVSNSEIITFDFNVSNIGFLVK